MQLEQLQGLHSVIRTTYVHAISTLSDRFGDPYKLVDAHVQAFIDMLNPSNSFTSLR